MRTAENAVDGLHEVSKMGCLLVTRSHVLVGLSQIAPPWFEFEPAVPDQESVVVILVFLQELSLRADQLVHEFPYEVARRDASFVYVLVGFDHFDECPV